MKTAVVLMILVGVVASQSPDENGTSGMPTDPNHAPQQAASHCILVNPAATSQQQIIINLPTCETSAAANASCRNCCTVAQEIAKLRDGQDELKRKLDDVIALIRSAPNNSLAPVDLPRDCSDPLLSEADSGVYRIQPLDQGPPIEVYCDMETDGGGWTMFQRRQNGSVDFFLYWEDYQRGFGDLNGEFWLGNDNLHSITSQGEYELRVDMTDFDDNSAYAVYDTFGFGDRSDSYRLTVSGFSGTAGDSLSHHTNAPFATRDRDSEDCANRFHGAWWYVGCHGSNLNGKYLRGATSEYATGVVWRQWKGYYYSLKTTEMKVKRNN